MECFQRGEEMTLFNYPKHKHPHGVENTPENCQRIWVCEDCACILSDEELRDDDHKIGHICKDPRNKRPCRCESHLEPYMPIGTEESK
jgi:hypothetical protein